MLSRSSSGKFFNKTPSTSSKGLSPPPSTSETMNQRQTTPSKDQKLPPGYFPGVRMCEKFHTMPWEADRLTAQALENDLKNTTIKYKPIQALLKDEDIWKTFTKEDTDSFGKLSENIVSGGVKVANAVLALEPVSSFFELVHDFAIDQAKDWAIEKSAGRIAGYCVLKEEEFQTKGWETWIPPDDDEPSPGTKLFKELGTGILAFALKTTVIGVAAGAAGLAGAVAAGLAIFLYFGEAERAEMRKKRSESARHAIETYNRIKEKSRQRIRARQHRGIERMYLSKAKEDYEDKFPAAVAEYWSDKDRKPKPITWRNIHVLREIYIRGGDLPLPLKQEAELWWEYRGVIQLASLDEEHLAYQKLSSNDRSKIVMKSKDIREGNDESKLPSTEEHTIVQSVHAVDPNSNVRTVRNRGQP